MRWFRNLRIARKLAIVTAAGIVAIVITALSGFLGLTTAGQMIRKILNTNLPAMTTAMDLKSNLNALRAAVATMISEADRAAQEAQEQVIKETSALIDVQLSLLAQLGEMDGQLATYVSESKKTWEELRAGIETQLIPAVVAGRVADIKDLAMRIQQDQFQMLISLADGVVKRLEEVNNQEKASTQEAITRSIGILLAFLALGVIVGLLTIFLSQAMIARPIRRVVKALQDIAEGEGDLTRHLEAQSKDEIGELAKWFNVFVDRIAALIRRIGETAQSLSSHSQELAATSEEATKAVNEVARTIQGVAQGAQQQVQSMGEAVQTIRHMARGIQEVAQTANQVAMASQEALQLSGHGGEAVLQVKKAMHSIHQTVGNSASVIKGLGEKSKNIGEIVNVITGIASQTNLLALNAAIEAARAGEQGRGFAVVAEEVRKLAEESAKAADQIGGLIKEIQGETNRAVETMGQGTKEVEQGVSVVEETGQAFERINKAVVQISGQTQGVSAATEELSRGTSHIERAVEHVVATSEQNASSAQEVSAATEEVTASINQIAQSAGSLAALAQDLQGLVGQFRV